VTETVEGALGARTERSDLYEVCSKCNGRGRIAHRDCQCVGSEDCPKCFGKGQTLTERGRRVAMALTEEVVLRAATVLRQESLALDVMRSTCMQSLADELSERYTELAKGNDRPRKRTLWETLEAPGYLHWFIPQRRVEK
jgi:hypothetical protein